MDDEEDNVRPSDDVTPELETVIDLIEQLRQNRADEEETPNSASSRW